jgi:hypothetical protein
MPSYLAASQTSLSSLHDTSPSPSPQSACNPPLEAPLSQPHTHTSLITYVYSEDGQEHEGNFSQPLWPDDKEAQLGTPVPEPIQWHLLSSSDPYGLGAEDPAF